MKIKFTLGIGMGNCRQEEVITYDEPPTETELEADWQRWAWNYIDGSQEIVEE